MVSKGELLTWLEGLNESALIGVDQLSLVVKDSFDSFKIGAIEGVEDEEGPHVCDRCECPLIGGAWRDGGYCPNCDA